jgi:hypothetical protein
MILWVYCLAGLFRMKTLAVISSHLSRIRSSQLLMCLTKSFECLFDLPKILCSLLLLKFLPACIMVNSILLVVFVGTPWLCHFEPNDAMCANARCHQVILLNCLLDSDVLPDMSWFSTIRAFNDCLAKSFNLSILDQNVCFWSFVLVIIIPLYLKHQTIQVFLESDDSTFFLPLIEYRYSHQLCCGSPDPLLDYYPIVSFIFNHLVSSSPDT